MKTVFVVLLCLLVSIEAKKKKPGKKAAAAKKAKKAAAASQRMADILTEAKAYMESQEPVKTSGGRPISELMADAEEAKQVVPYNHRKMMAARLELIKEEDSPCECVDTNCSKGNSPSAYTTSGLLAVMSAVMFIII
jgi:hypothetical protein